jgi:hypothetical protein
MKSKIGAGIAVAIALMFILITPISIIGHANATYPIGSVDMVLTFGIPTTFINNTLFNGPATSMTQLLDGTYLAFIREGTSHVGPGDYAVMKLYNSTDGVLWTYKSTIVNVADRDVRNYAAGTTLTGRVYVFYHVFDCDNSSWYHAYPQYISSDDDGASWSANTTLTLPPINGFTPEAGAVHGEVRQIGVSRICLTVYSWGGVSYQLRYVYSDNDGTTWSQVAMSALYTPLDNGITETDIAYLGNGQLISLSRIDGLHKQQMFSSSDYGLTWYDRGEMTTEYGWNFYDYPPSLTVIDDPIGGIWVLAVLAYNQILYTYASGQDLMAHGISAWITLIYYTGFSGLYATGAFDSSGHGIMTMSEQISGTLENMIVVDLVASRDYTSQQMTIIHFIDVIGVMLSIGVVVGVALAAIKPLNQGKQLNKQFTIDYLIRMFMFIVVGMALIGVYYSMYT